MADRQNQFSHLVRMLETRIARQKSALIESELQLTSAKESYLRVEEQIEQEKQNALKAVRK